ARSPSSSPAASRAAATACSGRAGPGPTAQPFPSGAPRGAPSRPSIVEPGPATRSRGDRLTGSPRRPRPAHRVAVAALPLALAMAAARPVAADQPLEASVRTRPDTVSASLKAPGAFQRIMAEADSAVRRQGGPRGENAQLYLSWNAPWGARRAARERMPACSDSTVEDTLYLSF